MNRNADCTSLIRNRTCNCLTNPPGSVCRKLKSLAVFKLFYSFNKTDVSFLNKVKEVKSTVCIFFCNRNYETKVCVDKAVFCLLDHKAAVFNVFGQLKNDFNIVFKLVFEAVKLTFDFLNLSVNLTDFICTHVEFLLKLCSL